MFSEIDHISFITEYLGTKIWNKESELTWEYQMNGVRLFDGHFTRIWFFAYPQFIFSFWIFHRFEFCNIEATIRRQGTIPVIVSGVRSPFTIDFRRNQFTLTKCFNNDHLRLSKQLSWFYNLTGVRTWLKAYKIKIILFDIESQ